MSTYPLVPTYRFAKNQPDTTSASGPKNHAGRTVGSPSTMAVPTIPTSPRTMNGNAMYHFVTGGSDG